MIRIVLPTHLKTLARIEGDVLLSVTTPITLGAVLDALEARYPMLRGTIRDYTTQERRAFIRFFACGQDFSDATLEAILPPEIQTGTQPFRVVGAMAGG